MKQLQLSKIEDKFINDKLDELSEQEIDYFIDEHWLEYTCRFNLYPCGDLTKVGKREYLQNNIDDVLEMIKQFPSTELSNGDSQ